MKEIGGYFELELPLNEEYHNNALRLNTGRNAFEYILRAEAYRKVYLPYYTCDVMLEPIHKLNLEVELYYIDKHFWPVFNFEKVKKQEVFVYNNYFGICNEQVNEIACRCKNLIIDNSQAFYAKPLKKVDTFYSPRKFFGVSDGAYLYVDRLWKENLETDVSHQRCEHLLGRIDLGAEAFYKSYKQNDAALIGQPIKKISNLTKRLLECINYNAIEKKRVENFNTLHNTLHKKNQLTIELSADAVPMVYPYLIDNGSELKKKLIANKIYTATYWPNVRNWVSDDNQFEIYLCENLVAIPIDQRVDLKIISFIINVIYNG